MIPGLGSLLLGTNDIIWHNNTFIFPCVPYIQFMRDKEEKSTKHRSAVTGKVIKMKVKKSSKDKEVNLLYYLSSTSFDNVYLVLVCRWRRKGKIQEMYRNLIKL